MMMKTERLYIVNLIYRIMPATRMYGVKRRLLQWAGATVGGNVRIASSARFYIKGPLSIGEGTWIGHEVLIAGGDAAITIGKNVDIAPRVSIISGSHVLFGVEGRAAGDGYSSPIIIGDGAWIGACATILGNVKIGEKCMVGAGSLVRKSTLPGCIVAGIPAENLTTSH